MSTESVATHTGAWQRRAAWALALAAFPLLLVGGLVTTYRVGMAVPDWPTTFGYSMFSYPLDQMLENVGVTIEHGHRMFATLVGVLTIVTLLLGLRGAPRVVGGLVALGLVFEFVGFGSLIARSGTGAAGTGVLDPATLLWLALSAATFSTLVLSSRVPAFLRAATLVHALVVGQGLLGGSRVLENATQLAFLHGALAQLVWASIAALLVVASVRWSAGEPRSSASSAGVWPIAALAFFLVYTQIVAGAWLRHSGRMDALGVHGIGAFAVTAVLIVLAQRLGALARSGEPAATVFASLQRWIWILLGVQIALGLLATVAIFFWSGGFAGRVSMGEAISATLHVAVGAALLGVTLAAWMWSAREVRQPDPNPDSSRQPARPAGIPSLGRTA